MKYEIKNNPQREHIRHDQKRPETNKMAETIHCSLLCYKCNRRIQAKLLALFSITITQGLPKVLDAILSDPSEGLFYCEGDMKYEDIKSNISPISYYNMYDMSEYLLTKTTYNDKEHSFMRSNDVISNSHLVHTLQCMDYFQARPNTL